MECYFDKSAKNVQPGNRILLAHSPKVEKFRFQPKFFPRNVPLPFWSRRMPIWGTWIFLASQNFLGKTNKRYKSVSSSRKSFFEMFLSSRRFRFGHPCRKLLPKIQKFFLEKQQTDSNLCFLSKKNVLSQSVSLDTWNAKLTTLPKLFRQETVFFLLIAQRSKCFGFSENFFLEMFRWTRRIPFRGTWSFLASQNFQTKTLKWYKVVSSSRKTFLKMFLWSRKFRFGDPCWKLLPTSGTSPFRISKQSRKYVFFRKK